MSTFFFWLMIIAFIVWGTLRITRNTNVHTTASTLADIHPAASTCDEVLNSFFRNTSNYANMPEARVFRAIGYPQEHDDWDFGRLVYYWNGQSISVRVVIQGGTVICAELIDQPAKSVFQKLLRYYGSGLRPFDWP